MVSTSRSSQSGHSTKPAGEQHAAWMRGVWTAVVVVLAASYFIWFLSFPVLAGLVGVDGQSISRLQFSSRVLLPDLWWAEVTGGGRLPLGIWDRWPIVLGTAAWLGIALVIGRPLVKLGFREVLRSEAAALAMLAGLALLSTLTLLVGLMGGSASRWAIGLPLVVMLSGAWFANWRLERSSAIDFQYSSEKRSASRVPWLPQNGAPSGVFGQLAGRLVVVLTLLLAAIYCLGLMMPPYEFDVVEYHLQAAKEFYSQGFIGFNDHNVYVNMPLGLEMHGLAAMSLVGGAAGTWPDGWWWGGLIGKAVIGAHALIAAVLVGGFVARKTNSQWIGWSAAGLWLSVPGNAHVATTGLIDAALSTYILASLVGLAELWDRFSIRGEASSQHSEWLVLLIFTFAGAAAAAKYPGLIYAVVPCCGALAVALSKGQFGTNWRRVSQWMLSLVCGLLLTCGPWYAKNVALTGNPVYPLAYSLFGGRGLDLARAEQWSLAHRVPVDGITGSPYSMGAFVASVKQILLASEFTQPSLLILVICGLVGSRVLGDSRRQWNWVWGWMLCSFWILTVWWLATHRIDRFWLPAVSIWAVVAGVGLAWLVTRVSHSLATVLVLGGLAYGVVVSASPVIGDNRFFVSLTALRTDGGDEENAGRISRAIVWCNENFAQTNSKLLLVGEARVFDFKMPILYSTCFDLSPAEKWLRGQSNEQQRANLQAAGVTHLMINWSELARYRSPGNYGFSDWPSREDVAKLTDSGVLKRVDWPLAADSAELFEVSASEDAPAKS